MKYVIIKINNPDEEYELIREELIQYNVLPNNVSSNWDLFEYLCYSSKENIITNYSGTALALNNSILCSSINEFIKEVKKELNTKEMKKDFTLNDLKPGMVVEYRNGSKRLVVSINGKLHLISDTDYLNDVLNYYNNDLTHINSDNFDIMKVYEVLSDGGLNYLLFSSYKKLIWERKELKVYTMQEIADKLGIPVEQLRIKK